MLRISLRILVAAACIASAASAQVAPDRDRTLFPVGNTPAANGTRALFGGGFRNAYYVRDFVSWNHGRHAVGSSSSPCDLVVDAGGTLEITDSQTKIYGDVVILPGGLLRVRDGDFVLGGQAPHDYAFHFLGGQLDTLRASIGGNPATGAVGNFFLDKGLWTARDTVVNYTGGIIVGSLDGRYGDQRRNGGTLFANGLIAGVASDFLHLSGRGNATLHNSAFRVSLLLPDTGPTSAPIPLQLGSNQLYAAPTVFGDPAVHDGTNRPSVTNPIPGLPWRLELVNTTVSNWSVKFFDVGPGTSARTYELQGADGVFIGIHASGLTGSPVRVGPWGTYFPPPYELPELPTTAEPGYHGIPPDCGLRIGSVTIQSAPNDWTKVVSWGFYLSGATAFSISGPTRIGELVLRDTSQVTLSGVEGFDSGLRCVTAQLSGMARLVVRDATIGSEDVHFGDLLATGQSTADLDRVRMRRLQLRTGAQTAGGSLLGVDAATITLGHHVRSWVPGEMFATAASPGGTIAFADDEFANSDFEDAVVSGVPRGWTTASVGCSASTNLSPGSPGNRSVIYQSNSSSGALRRTAVLPERTPIEVHAWVRPVSMPSGSYELRLRDGNGYQVATPLPVSGGWQFVSLPPFTVSAGTNQVILEIRHYGTSGQVTMRIDDVIVRTPGYWESDNLLNLGFEEPRQRRHAPTPNATDGPDYWQTLHAHGTSITTGLRPGASGRAIRLDVDGRRAALRKNLYFPVPGQEMTVTGWIKSIGPGGSFDVDVFVGTGNRYWDTSIPSTQWQRLFSVNNWTQFSLTYTVPAPPEFLGFTTIAIAGGTNGDSILVDDVAVTFQ